MRPTRPISAADKAAKMSALKSKIVAIALATEAAYRAAASRRG